MNNYLNKRVIELADYIIKTKDTIRETAKYYNLSKSTVHKDLKNRLKDIDSKKYKLVQEIMLEHTLSRHIRGGEQTRLLFLRKKQVPL